MTHDAPLSPRPLAALSEAAPSVMTVRALHEHGVTPATTAERCRPGGPWRTLLPGVCLLRSGEPTGGERARAALLYADAAGAAPDARTAAGPVAMVTGLAALALHRFAAAPSLRDCERVDVLVPRGRRLRSAGWARVVRSPVLPDAEEVTGLRVAPVPRALADALAGLTDATRARRLLTEAVRGGHCEAGVVLAELAGARLLDRAHLADAVAGLLAERRAQAEGRLYDMVLHHELPDPCWNVELRTPRARSLGTVDAYWPDHGVALELDERSGPHGRSEPHGRSGPYGSDAARRAVVHRREMLEEHGVTLLHVTPDKLHTALGQQAAVVRTALMTSAERGPVPAVRALPR
ncbi:hypothetical protein [Streptomyces sp. NRRL F-5053]|uniref:hypothetical protein n=1 Tax=Streptomyces sp. NRRL F-5053 TaxID=1463854 RepID=UPI0004C4C32B|nr:hypothetical protein [Streptomyces sp. NRRL F-5053]